jgi:hypothetical protein
MFNRKSFQASINDLSLQKYQNNNYLQSHRNIYSNRIKT